MVKAAQDKKVIFYQKKNGGEPFSEWMDTIRDAITRKRILARIRRLESGNYGDCESVGENVSELRLFFGAGYRVYFGEEKNGNIVIILCGGDKSTQDRDIKTAKEYWKEYLNHDKI